MIPVTLVFVFSGVVQAFHFQEHAREPEPRGRGGRVPGPSHRRPQHRPAALGARQEVSAHLQGARPGEEGQGVDMHARTHTHTHLFSQGGINRICSDRQSRLCKKLLRHLLLTPPPPPASPDEVAQSPIPAPVSFSEGGTRKRAMPIQTGKNAASRRFSS